MADQRLRPSNNEMQSSHGSNGGSLLISVLEGSPLARS